MTEDDKPKDDRPFHVRASDAMQRNNSNEPYAPDDLNGPPLTPQERAAENLRRMFPPHRQAPKLTHDGHCEVYACLYYQIPQYVVAKAFDLTPSTVSIIARCRSQNMNCKVRYAAVEAEFDSLGEAEFMRRYFTDRVQAKIMRVKAEIKNKVWLD